MLGDDHLFNSYFNVSPGRYVGMPTNLEGLKHPLKMRGCYFSPPGVNALPAPLLQGRTLWCEFQDEVEHPPVIKVANEKSCKPGNPPLPSGLAYLRVAASLGWSPRKLWRQQTRWSFYGTSSTLKGERWPHKLLQMKLLEFSTAMWNHERTFFPQKLEACGLKVLDVFSVQYQYPGQSKALFKGVLFSFAKVRGNLATNKQQNALR